MTKKELIELAEKHNVAVNAKATVADIQAALVAANIIEQAAPATDEATTDESAQSVEEATTAEETDAEEQAAPADEAVTEEAPKEEPTKGGYHVRLPKGWPHPQRQRAGIVVLAGEDGYTGPLTKEQLAEIKSDPALTVTKVD